MNGISYSMIGGFWEIELKMTTRNAQDEYPTWRESLLPSPMGFSRPFQCLFHHSTVNEKYTSRKKTILLKGATAAAYTYDAATGRYATVKNSSATVTYSYLDKTDLPLVQTRQKGTSSAFLTVSNTYDAYNRLTLINANSSNQAAYVYDSLGRRTSATLQDDTAWHYTYNQRSEITGAIRKNASNVTQNTMRYNFDNIGNRTSSYEDATSKTYDANSLNQYTEIDVTGGSTVCPLYDDDGNMTQYGDWTYTYDAENRLVGALVIHPSMLSHRHAIPSISSFSASPFFQSFRNNPSLSVSGNNDGRCWCCRIPSARLPISCTGNKYEPLKNVAIIHRFPSGSVFSLLR